MSEPIPESIPTSSDPRSKRPTKRLALTPSSQQATQISTLFAKPDRDITIPSTSSKSTPYLAPPPEIVANVQGSSAGAGSGEFHVYKASRRREYERLRLMDEEVKREKENEDFEKAKEERKRRDEEKTKKNKARREKMKAKKGAKAVGDEKEALDKEGEGLTKGREKAGSTKNRNGVKDDRGEDVEQEEVPQAVVEEIGVIIHDDD